MRDLQRDGDSAGALWRRAGRGHVAALLGLTAVLLCCGGRAPAAQSPGPAPGGDAGRSTARAGQPEPARDPAGQPSGPDTHEGGSARSVTESDCQALLAHVVAVANAAHVQTVAPEHAPTEEQLAAIRTRMAPEFVPMCLSLDRATLACQMRARTHDELLACMPP